MLGVFCDTTDTENLPIDKDTKNMWQDTSRLFLNTVENRPSGETETARSKYIAVRLKRFSDAEKAFGQSDKWRHPRQLLASRVDKRDPALRNFTEGLEKRGLQFIVDGCALYWLQISDQNSLEYYMERNEVECVFFCDWFDEFKRTIRYYQGKQYVDECIALGEGFTVKDQNRKIDY